jgi:hypothetical protein
MIRISDYKRSDDNQNGDAELIVQVQRGHRYLKKAVCDEL